MGNREQNAVDFSSIDPSEGSLESVLLQLATDFLDLPADQLERGVTRILGVIGEFSGADCSGVSELVHGSGTIKELHSWTRPGGVERSLAGSDIDARGLAEIFGDLDEPILVADAIADRRFPVGIGEAFAAAGVRALAWFPVVSNRERIVAVGVTAAAPVVWSEDLVSLLQVAGRMIANLRSRSATHASLHESTLLLEGLARSIDHHFFMMAVDPPRLLYSNDGISKLSGWEIGDFRKDPERLMDVVLPEYRRPLLELFERGASQRAEFEYQVRAADGGTRWMRTKVFPGTDEKGLGAHLAGLTEDITERVVLSERENRLDALESILSRTSARFVHAGHGAMDDAIAQALTEICEFVEVEIGHVYFFDQSREQMREIARWQSIETVRHADELRTVPREKAPHLMDTTLAGRTVALETPEDIPQSAVADRAFFDRHQIRSCLLVPLSSSARPFGALALATVSRNRGWSEEDVALSQLAANTFASAVARHSAEGQEREKARFERLITELISDFMNLPAAQLDDGIERALATIARFVGCDRAAIYLVEQGGEYADVYSGWLEPGALPISKQDTRIDTRPGSLVGDWLLSEEPYLALKTEEIRRVRPQEPLAPADAGVGTVVNVPIVIDGRRIGWFVVGAKLPRVDWTDSEIRSLSVGADALANMYARRLTELDRQRHQDFEEILSELASDFIKRPITEIRTGIEEIVDRYGRFAGSDRAAILLLDTQKRTASTYYESVRRGVPAPVVDFPIGDAPSFYQQVISSPGPWLMYAEDFPESDREAATALEIIGIRTLLNCPIAVDGHVLGYASIGYSNRRHRPAPGTEQLLEIAAGIVANALARERLEQQARLRNEALSHALRIGSLNQLATGLAHELNQPLTAIANYTRACVRLVERGELEQDSVANILSRVSDEALRAGDIVRNLRAHVRTGRRKRTASSIVTIVDHACSLVGGTGNDNGVQLIVDYGTDLPEVQVEPTEIEQVVINLLQNAIESIASNDLEARDVTISVRHNHPHVDVEISDTGPGFAAEDIGKLFDQFYTTKPGGLGLGLSISRDLAESNGGRLDAVPSEAGAVFRLSLPAAPRGRKNEGPTPQVGP